MGKMKHAGMFILGLAVVGSLVPATVFAQTTTSPPASTTDARCTVAKERIAVLAPKVSTLQTERTNQYTSINDRVSRFITSSTAAKYTDVAKLTTAHDSVKQSIEAYSTQASKYKGALEKVQSIPCTQMNEFTVALTTARSELTKLRTSNTAVKTAIKQQAVPALQNYATWLKTNTAKESQ